jgi:hypothetical protein
MKQTKRFRNALRGLEGITVWVHDIAEDAQRDGLSRQRLQDLVVVGLLDSGVRALGIGNVPEPPGNPWLNVFVNTVKFEDVYFFSITIRLDEIVRQERMPEFKTFGTTWETGSRGLAEKAEMPATIEKEVDDLIEYFIYDFHTANPQP